MENLEILEPAIFSEEIRKVEEEEFITAEIENEIKNNNFTSLTLFPFNFNCSYADIQLIGRIY